MKLWRVLVLGGVMAAAAATFAFCDEQPPYELKDPAATENFRSIYYAVDKLSLLTTLFSYSLDSTTNRLCLDSPTLCVDSLNHRISIASGTLAGPSLIVGTSTVTGFYSPSPDTIGITTNGTMEALFGPSSADLNYSVAGDGGLMVTNNFSGVGGGAAYFIARNDSGHTAAFAKFSSNYVALRLGLPITDGTEIRTAGGGLWIEVTNTAPIYMGTNQTLQFALFSSSLTLTTPLYLSSGAIVSNLTATTVPYLDANKKLTSSAVTPTTLAFLDASSSIQTQLNAKAPTDSPTFTGTITASSATFSGTLAANAAAGNAIHGTNTNDNAATGYIGEYISTVTAAYKPAVGSGFGNDYVSLTVTAGDWDISMCLDLWANGATVTNADAWIGTTAGNNGAGRLTGDTDASVTPGPSASGTVTICVPNVRKSVSSSTSYYLKSIITYSVATPSGFGRMSARRAR